MSSSDSVILERGALGDMLIEIERAGVAMSLTAGFRIWGAEQASALVIVSFGSDNATLSIEVDDVERIARQMIQRGRYVQASTLRAAAMEAKAIDDFLRSPASSVGTHGG